MFKKRLEKKEKLKARLQKYYDAGYQKATQQKNEEIRKLKIKHAYIIKEKDDLLTEQQKKINSIEQSLNQHSELVCITNSIIKKIKNNSYAQTLLIQKDHQQIETINDEIELLEIKVNRDKLKLDTKILEFKRKAGM